MDADDVTQEVFIRIWQNIDTFNIMAAKTWIMKTTHNLCMDYLRKRKRAFKNECEINDEFEESYSDSGISGNPLLSVHLDMMADVAREAVQRLPDPLRSAFVLYELQGMKYKEISQILDIPLNSVKVYILRARKKLQEDLREYAANEII